MSDGYRRLRDTLDGLEPAGFEALEDEELRRLAAAIERARAEHDRALDEATERSLSHVPRLLRPAVRRIVGA